MTPTHTRSGLGLRVWAAGFAIVSGALAAGGYWYYQVEAGAVRQARHREISAIGALKAGQIAQWRKERLSAVGHLGSDPVVAGEIQELLRAPGDRNAGGGLLGRVRVEHDGNLHSNALLLTLDGTPLVAARDDPGPVNPATTRAIEVSLAGGSPVLSDLYRGLDGRISIDAVAVVRDTAGRPLAAAILRSDAAAYLYPLIESWPTPSPSAETFIVQRDGGDALWLNTSRHRAGTALSLRQPLSTVHLAAVQAVLGRQGVFESRDYRNVAVIADLHPIDGSPWFMVAKIDLDEVLAEARYRARATGLVVALLILLAAAVSAFAYQWRQAWLDRVRRETRSREHAARRASELTEAERIAGIGSYVWTISTGALRWSDGLNLLLRRDPALPLPTFDTLARFYTPQSWDTLRASAARVIETGSPETIEVEMIRDDGTTVWTQSRAEVLRGPDGAVVAVQGTVHDIDERKRAEAERRERDQRYLLQRNALIDLIKSEALNSDDLPNAFRQITEVAARTLGVARVSIWRYTGDRTGIRCDDLYELEAGRHSSGAELTESLYPAYFSALGDVPVIVADDARTDARTGEFSESYLIPLGITSMLDAPILLGGAVVGVLCHEHIGPVRQWTMDESAFAVAVANAVSLVLEGWERRRAEAGLRLQSAALNAAASAIVITSRAGEIVWINPAFTALTGYSDRDAIGKKPGDLLKSGVHDRSFYADLWNTILAGHVWRGEVTNRRKDGSVYLEGMSITPVRNGDGEIAHFIAIKRDLTEKKQLEAQLLQSQKMEVVGRLAGGIAHDFNNLLTVINGVAELMADSVKEGDPLRDDLREIQAAGARAATLTRQLLAFSRKQVMTAEVISVTAVIADLRSMLQRMIGEDIALTIKPAASACWIRADRGQIEQVLMNLVVNARDALPGGGVVTIAARDVDLDSAQAAQHGLTAAGPHVLVEVRDTGTGMDAATRARLFEPFFTTKGPGKGTGLGLATVYGIVRQSGGSIAVDSAVGRGTTFGIYLPRAADAAQAVERGAAAPAPAARTILVVEDEDRVRQMTRRMLESTGYHVLTAPNGAEALQMLERREQPVHLMLTDVVMPGMSGPDLEARAAGIRPEMRTLYMSGHTDNDALRRAVLDRATHFIGKPFTREELVRAVRETLDATGTAPLVSPAVPAVPGG